MKRAALILARGFEESESLTIADVLIRAGLTCELTGLEEEIVEGAHGIQVKCDRVLGEDLTDYDMIILPGGYGGVDAMSGNEVLIRILQEMDRKGKFVCAICAAPAVLEKAGLLEGRRCGLKPPGGPADAGKTGLHQHFLLPADAVPALSLGGGSDPDLLLHRLLL